MQKNIHVPQIKQPFNILKRSLNISNQNIHNLIYSSRFHWDEESITTAYLASIYGHKYSIDGTCFECGTSFSTCPNGNTPPLSTKARVASFNRSQESKHSGSDFLLSYQGNKFLIQAKVIADSTPMNIGAWKKIFHNKEQKQLETLLKFALKYEAKAYYLFYVMSNSPHHSIKTKCEEHTSPYDTFSLMIPAIELHRMMHRKNWSGWGNKKKTFSDIISPNCIPFTCFFKSCQTNNPMPVSQPNSFKLLDILDILTILKDTSDILEVLDELIWASVPDIFDGCREAFDESAILEILKRSGKIDLLDGISEKEKEVTEFVIDESLVNASEVKERAFIEFSQPETDLVNKFEEPSREAVSFILSLLKPDEFTTFSDIAKLFNEPSQNSALFSVRGFILSEDVLPEDAVKVVAKTDIKSERIDLRGNFNSYYGYDSRLDVIKEFYPHLKVEDGMLKIGEKPSEAKYVGTEGLRKKIQDFRDR